MYAVDDLKESLFSSQVLTQPSNKSHSETKEIKKRDFGRSLKPRDWTYQRAKSYLWFCGVHGGRFHIFLVQHSIHYSRDAFPLPFSAEDLLGPPHAYQDKVYAVSNASLFWADVTKRTVLSTSIPLYAQSLAISQSSGKAYVVYGPDESETLLLQAYTLQGDAPVPNGDPLQVLRHNTCY